MKHCKNCKHFGAVATEKLTMDINWKEKWVITYYCDPDRNLKKIFSRMTAVEFHKMFVSELNGSIRVCEDAEHCPDYQRSWWKIWAEK